MAGRRTTAGRTVDFAGFIQAVTLLRDDLPSLDAYPFSIPAIGALTTLQLDPSVTFLVGENGSGKSTLIEAIAVAAGFNAEGGSSNFSFSTRRSESALHQHLRLTRSPRRPRTDFFLRAESYFNVATEIERLDEEGRGERIIDFYGGVSLHEQSHGESFMALVKHRFGPRGLYILDEPEAALSPQRQLALLAFVHRLASSQCQFIIATHSPILMAYPGAVIYSLGSDGIAEVEYEQTEHYEVTRNFLNHRERYFKHLFETDDPPEE